MIDLNKPKKDDANNSWEPEEIAVAVLAMLIWVPMLFRLIGII